MSVITNAKTLVTGATGSFGHAFVRKALHLNPQVIRCFSRDELKQAEMAAEFGNDPRLRFLVGDVRDLERLTRACQGIDYIIHASALKRVDSCEYNPLEAIKTNIGGTQNIILAALNTGVKRVLFLSTDKACAPCNLYGKTKAVAESLIVQANVYEQKFAAVRYGNVIASRGSVIPLFQQQAKTGTITITHPHMTRFWISLDQGVQFVLDCLERMKGGEIFVPKIPAMKITDLAQVIAPRAKVKITKIRPGEKIHESLITEEEARHAKEFDTYYVIEPQFPYWDDTPSIGGKELPEGFRYTSETAEKLQWDELLSLIGERDDKRV